jgi:recombination protein RecA
MAKKESANLKKALAALDKKFGENTVIKMDKACVNVNTISTGRPKLDAALGGGFGKGKIIEIFSENGCGKTGLALDTAAQVQKNGGRVAIIDAEHALNTEYCEQTGVKIEDIYFSQPDYGEQAVEIIRALVASNEFDLIIIDSIAAMTPRAILQGESGQAHMAVQARMMGQFMAMIKGPASDNECTLICINQIRETLAMYGSPTTTPGGKALKFYASQRLEIKKKGDIKAGDEVIGFKQLVKIVKNKLAPPFREVLSDIVFGKGIDTIGDFIEACMYEGIIVKSGSFFSYDPNCAKIQGMKKLRDLFEDNPDLVDLLQVRLDKAMGK